MGLKIGKDWAGYVSAATALGGDKTTSKAFSILQTMKEKKRDRSAIKVSGASKGAVYRDYFSEDNDYPV